LFAFSYPAEFRFIRLTQTDKTHTHPAQWEVKFELVRHAKEPASDPQDLDEVTDENLVLGFVEFFGILSE
jgi:hypothetical protein